MVLTVSTNASRLLKQDLLWLFRDWPPYRVVVSMYGATEESLDELTQRRSAYRNFRKGMAAVRSVGPHVRVSVVVREDNAHEADDMMALAVAVAVAVGRGLGAGPSRLHQHAADVLGYGRAPPRRPVRGVPARAPGLRGLPDGGGARRGGFTGTVGRAV
ncbi:hypothetical protein K1Y78_37320 [Streptomyces sp. tea 10]|nr:hypothetical protein [Streptomyces sp. tea 10]